MLILKRNLSDIAIRYWSRFEEGIVQGYICLNVRTNMSDQGSGLFAILS